MLFYVLDEYEYCNPDFPHDEYMPFDLDDMDEIECLAEFQFEKQHIPLLAEALKIPPYFIMEQRSRMTGIEGLCILLKRVAYPCRYSDMIHRFARPVPVLSMVTNKVLNHLYQIHGHRLTQWNDTILPPKALEQYTEEFIIKMHHCFGSIDEI